MPYSTVVSDKNGELLGVRLASDGQWRFPPTESVPQKYADCLIAFEDRYFYYHWGVNPFAVGRALIQNIKAREVVSGASTITMQTVRLSRGKNRTVWEKFIEMLWATRMEFRYSKKEILALYASHAPFGGNVVGIDAAAWRYFNHSANELSWAEAATLAVLPNSPSMVHIAKNRNQLLTKRDKLLHKLYQKGIIDVNDYELAISETIPDNVYSLPKSAPHLVTYFYLHNNGEQIQTTIDKQVQSRLEEIIRQWNGIFMQQDIHNIAAIIVDIQTNEVVAYCANVQDNQQVNGNQVDIIRSVRSPGSLLKPLLFYAALDEGLILPNQLIADIPLNINGFTPQNFNNQYDGAVPASEAITRSLNVPAVVLLRKFTVPKFYDFLKRSGISSLSRPPSEYGLSLILGGVEVKMWDVVSIYSNMGRSLLNLPKKELTLLKTNNNRISTPNGFHKGAVWQTFEAIKELNRPEDIDWQSIPSMQTIAWKTGTSYGFRDGWAVGVTPKYVVGVWVGNASGEGRPGLVGARTAGPVMFDIFNFLPSSKWFSKPYNDLIEVEVCRQSGFLKGRFCPDIDTISIVPNGLRSLPCPYHQLVVNQNNSEDRQVAFILPPAWEWYYKQRNPDYCAANSYSSLSNNAGKMQFIYPSNQTTHINIPKQLDGTPGVVNFELAHSRSNAIVFWHVDQDYITQTSDFHQLPIHLSMGEHTITVVDDEGNSLTVKVIVEP